MTMFYTQKQMLNLLDPEPVDKSLEEMGYSKELLLCECGKDAYNQEIINYYIKEKMISILIENKNSKLHYMFLKKE